LHIYMRSNPNFHVLLGWQNLYKQMIRFCMQFEPQRDAHNCASRTALSKT
jgi:hypothetical protein